jgi:hypothetical protein
MSGFIYKAFGVIWKGCLGVSGIVATAAAVLYYLQEEICYMPLPKGRGLSKLTSGNQAGCLSPAEYSMKGKYRGKDRKKGHRKEKGQGQGQEPSIPFEEAYVPTPDGEKIHVWLMHHPRAQGQKPLPTLVCVCVCVYECVKYYIRLDYIRLDLGSFNFNLFYIGTLLACVFQ